MNPDTNKFQAHNLEKMLKKFYGDRDEDQMPAFTLGEDIMIKGYIFKVIQITEDRLVFRPVRNALKAELEALKSELPKEGE